MRKIIFTLAMIVTMASACIAPIKPIPPIGCSSSDAVLVNDGGSCYWIFIGCGND